MNYMKVGMDASKEKLVCAYRANGVGEVKMVTLANRKEAVKPWIEKLQMQGIVQVCYEASSVGYEIYRWVTGMGAEGLTGREYSSGAVVRRGAITKTGNARVRHLLIQAAWKYTRKPLWSERLRDHWKTQPAALEVIAQKAKDRLYKRYHHLVNRGKVKQKAVVAIARELAGFLWAAGQIEATAA